MLKNLLIIGLLMVVNTSVKAASFQVTSSLPGKIYIAWEGIGAKSFIKELRKSTGDTQSHTISTTNGGMTLSRLSGEYNFTLFDCRETAPPPGSLIICTQPPLQRSVKVSPICSDNIGKLPEDFGLGRYKVYLGDFDADNQKKDLLFFGVEQVILLHGDIITPVVISAPASFKMISQSDGSYVREAAEKVCEGSLRKEYDESLVTSLVQSGAISQVSPAHIKMANFNNDGRDDLIVRVAGQVSVFHWNNSGPEYASQLNIPTGYRIELIDISGDGRSDIHVYNGSEFIQVFIADNQGYFVDPDSNVDNNDTESKQRTIEKTWQMFSDALKRGDHAACRQYLTPNFSQRFVEVLDVLGEEAGEVVDQVESIVPYYADDKVAIYLVKKLDDSGGVNIHTIIFQANENGSWKIGEM